MLLVLRVNLTREAIWNATLFEIGHVVLGAIHLHHIHQVLGGRTHVSCQVGNRLKEITCKTRSHSDQGISVNIGYIYICAL